MELLEFLNVFSTTQQVFFGLGIFSVILVVIYIIDQSNRARYLSLQKEFKKALETQDAKADQLVKRNKTLIFEFIEEVRAVPIGVFRPDIVIETFKDAPSGSVYGKEEGGAFKKLYPDWYVYGDLIRDYLIKITLVENRKDISPASQELIPEWINRIDQNPPMDWGVWKKLHSFLFNLAIKINDELHEEKEKNNRESLDQLKFGGFWKEDREIINNFFEILNKKVFHIDDYGDVVFSGDIFDHEFQVFLKKISIKPQSENELKDFLHRKFQEYLKNLKS